MSWTKELPTVTGWYWYREPCYGIGMVHVANYYGANDLQATFAGNECESSLRELGGEWFGPMEPPK